MIDSDFIKNRIAELRLKKDVSEYQMSLDLGNNKSYIQGISSGKALPSMREFLSICEYLNITPSQFFDVEVENPLLIKQINDGIKTLGEKDLTMLLGIIDRLNGE
jgi:transcriptional regulator with XRE-family HTH domain